uniref:Uncharacterized protein n=1 Tax=Arundo donax TaxID=35708 RepID=A0A0A9GZJ6_ARUDO
MPKYDGCCFCILFFYISSSKRFFGKHVFNS